MQATIGQEESTKCFYQSEYTQWGPCNKTLYAKCGSSKFERSLIYILQETSVPGVFFEPLKHVTDM